MVGKSRQAFITGLTADMPILPAMAWWRTLSCRTAELCESRSDTNSGEHGVRPVAMLHRSAARGPVHARLDLRLSSHTRESTELSVVEQNLLQPRTWEHGDSLPMNG